MHELYLAITVVGAVVLGLGLVSRYLQEHGLLSVPMLAVGIGMLLGPDGLDWLDPHRWGTMEVIVEESARLTLAIALMGIALRLPPRFLFDHGRSFLVILLVVMPAMWMVSSLLGYWLLELPLALCFLLGAILTPTDPVVASSIATGSFAESHLPGRVRHLLSGESGANDGLAYVFVMAPLIALTQPMASGVHDWLVDVLLIDVMGAVILGMIIGLGAGRLLVWGERKKTFERISFLSYTVALALLTIGSAKLLGIDGILAVFVAGIAFDNVAGGTERAEEASIQETVNQFFTLPTFILFGLVAPLDEWTQLGWPGWLYPLLILLLRRLPAILLLRRLIPASSGATDALYVGWFGPIGISALLYAMLALHHQVTSHLWHIASLVIFASIIVHGATATPFTQLYRRQGVQSL